MITLRQLFPDWLGQDVSVTGLALDSRQVKSGYLFLAVPGLKVDGRDYIDQAIEAGAVAVAYDATDDRHYEGAVPMLAVPQLAEQISAIAGRFYGEPSAALTLVGITGTNGKTSVSQMLAQALNELDTPCGVIGTLGSGMPGALTDHGMTTPDAVNVQGQLARLRDAGAAAVCMEVSSHALDQGRVAALAFDVAVFTNLTRDHLDYHGDMISYEAAKARLFDAGGCHAVINLDDPAGRRLMERCPPREGTARLLGFSLMDATAPLHCSDVRYDAAGIHALLHFEDEQSSLHSELLGEFNLSNLLAVTGSLLVLGFSLHQAVERAAGLRAPAGRMQRLGGGSRPLVVVDYAHTPDALEKALIALRAHVSGRLTCIFGCGGNRDAGKRPLMGQIAERYADRVVVTDDNPRNEPSASIIGQICQGLGKPQNITVLANRAEAIAHTISRAHHEDVILLAGKGHETYQEINGVRHAFSDIEQAERALQQWEASHA
ncbi:UDP-N-acetylmuramoyl-L-alanyl-D-glutamate--2,6-diaminopimelate ligase [Pseudomonas sp. gcc21]|uniref:UDP-N-acetylmuramoyl-L-alanyl-D-glutamate--2, 6-diaminopimelate ligase n=1 Tax=Pseudomonas sp. gcc21 TaxID=2726989 RepID=UPI00145269E5|nr:UDP-N-acetylmuramoyl-L-alanyl-D-glutamate--2,6-diaminopimelate ligase [Pseudomonas sp. gcc21]QJD59132.1 UDP-N-acetylmuramoyl-L-alanyl-D-glutamate--2,6-diaminopimelate ligase [Pseudomonas sp. gcc21]